RPELDARARALPRTRPTPASVLVHRLDRVGEVLVHAVALDLERGRELAVLDGEVALEDGELLDLLDARELLVDLVEVRLDRRAHRLVLVRRLGIDPHRRDALRIEGDERREVFAAVADHDGLVDELVVLERGLEVLRRDVLAAGRDDDVLLAAGDVEEAVTEL